MNLYKNGILSALIVVLFTFYPASGLKAAFIEPNSVLYQVLEMNKYVFQFYAEVDVSVYDPESFAPLDEDTNLILQPNELKDRSYSQHIVFVRDEFVSIETVDDSDTPLHIYIHEIGGSTLMRNLSSDRSFSYEDVQLPSLILFTKHVSLLHSSLSEMGINPNQLELSHDEYLIQYLIGTKRNHLLVDTNTFKALGITRQIQYQGRYYPLTIAFSDWDKQKKSIPLTTRFYIKSRLFKEVNIDSMRFSGIFSKRNAIVRKYGHLMKADYPFSMSTNWGQ